MINEIQIVEEPVKTLSMNPKKFILWLFLASIVMLFAAMTSAYIVRKVEGNWLDFQLPSIFITTTVVILMSSITMQWAYTLVRNDDLNKAKIALGLTFVLGLLFLVGQVMGWGDLVGADVYLVGNPAGSFLYILTGLHGLHLIAGLVFILIAFIAVVKYKVHLGISQQWRCVSHSGISLEDFGSIYIYSYF